MSGAGLNKISIVIPGSSTVPAADRDAAITQLKTAIAGTWQFYRYTDTTSYFVAWAYLAIGVVINSGVTTVATVSCSGMTHQLSGSNTVGMADPGPGSTYTWVSVGAPLSLRTSGDGGGQGTAPAQNSGYNVWNIPGNSSTAATDFTSAITAVDANLSSFVTKKLFKYVDSASGTWQVWSIWFAPGYQWYAAGAAVAAPNTNIFYVVTCAGTTSPLMGSPTPAVALPSFTQTFTTITAPLSFGPMR